MEGKIDSPDPLFPVKGFSDRSSSWTPDLFIHLTTRYHRIHKTHSPTWMHLLPSKQTFLLFSVTSQIQLLKSSLDSLTPHIFGYQVVQSLRFIYLHILNSDYHYLSSGFISAVPSDSIHTIQLIFYTATQAFSKLPICQTSKNSMASCHCMFLLRGPFMFLPCLPL